MTTLHTCMSTGPIIGTQRALQVWQYNKLLTSLPFSISDARIVKYNDSWITSKGQVRQLFPLKCVPRVLVVAQSLEQSNSAVRIQTIANFIDFHWQYCHLRLTTQVISTIDKKVHAHRRSHTSSVTRKKLPNVYKSCPK